MTTFWLYILRCADGAYYVGHTDDLERRVWEHQTGEIPGWTSKRRPVELVYSCEFDTREDAFERERQVKGWSRVKKEALIRGDWAALQALSHTARDSAEPAREPAHPELVEGRAGEVPAARGSTSSPRATFGSPGSPAGGSTSRALSPSKGSPRATTKTPTNT